MLNGVCIPSEVSFDSNPFEIFYPEAGGRKMKFLCFIGACSAGTSFANISKMRNRKSKQNHINQHGLYVIVDYLGGMH